MNEEKKNMMPPKDAKAKSGKSPKPVKEKKVKEPKQPKEKKIKEPKPIKEKKVKPPKPVKAPKPPKPPKPIKEKKVKEPKAPKPVKEKKVKSNKPVKSKNINTKRPEKIKKTNDKVSKKSRKIKTKLISAFMVPIILFVCVGIIIYSLSEKGLKENAEDLTFTSVDMVKQYFDLGFQSIELSGTRICNNSEVCSHFGGLYENTYEVPARQVAVDESVADIYIQEIFMFGQNQDNVITNTGIKKKNVYEDFVKSDLCKYIEDNMVDDKCWITEHEELDSVLGYSKNDYALCLVKRIVDSKNVPAGYVFIDVKTKFIMSMLDDADFGKGSIKALILPDGTEVVSGKENFNFSDKSFYKKVKGKESGINYIDYKGESYLFVYDKLNISGGTVVAIIPSSAIIERANEIGIFTIVTIIASCVIAIIIGTLLATGIAKTIKEFNNVMKKTSEGDLTSTVSVKRNDEFKILSGNIGNMITSVKSLIVKLTTVSEQVNVSAEKVNDNSEVLYEATKEITQSIDEIERGLVQQATDTENCLNQMSDLADRIAVVYDSTSQIEKIAGKTQETVDGGMDIVTNLENRVFDTTKITKDIIFDISELQKEAKEINLITTTINEIADETNLLSLNASIEAARAGEAGKGFVVVSEEIRKLAEQSSEAGAKINEIVLRIQQRIGKTIDTATRADEIVNYQVEALSTTVGVFTDIKDSVNVLANNLDTISMNIQGMETAKNDTMEAITSISATSNETEAASSELSRNADKQMKAVEVLYNEVKQLQENSDELEKSVSIFKVK